MEIKKFIKLANNFGKQNIPFLFLLDFEMEKPFLCKLSKSSKLGYLYNIKNKMSVSNNISEIKSDKIIESIPIAKIKYTQAFNLVMDNLQAGNTYLLNLTFPSEIKTRMSLKDIFYYSNAPYKFCHPDKFVIFSPECFIRIKNNFIYSYPMKGTIDASIPDARDKILQNEKETREHNTIVDLIRNDLSMVSSNVSVTKYRYIDKIETNKNQLLQVSSEIRGELDDDWRNKIGNILYKLLPAGSISGAPKHKTIEIIKQAEKQKRGYYTGIFGVFDGHELDSAVNIRYIEKINDRLQFRSGGGITAMSKLEEEYKEMLEKIYVPLG